MTALLVTLSAMASLTREFGYLIRNPDARALIFWMIGLLGLGTVFYHFSEGWNWLDSLYFCVITLSTVGYGDLDPSSPASKIFTMLYIFMGLSIFVSLVNMLAKARAEIQTERSARRRQRHASSPDNTSANTSTASSGNSSGDAAENAAGEPVQDASADAGTAKS